MDIKKANEICVILNRLTKIVFLFSLFVLVGCGNGQKNEQKTLEKRIKAYQEISKAVETNEGKMNLDNVTERDDWDKFCLVMTYSIPEEELKEFIIDPSSIDNFLPDSYDDSFGLGVLFVKDKKVIDSTYLSRYYTAVPASSDVGEFVRSISGVSSNGSLVPPRLDPKFGKSNESPKGTCYTREYTIKIHKDWEFTIVKRKNNDE